MTIKDGRQWATSLAEIRRDHIERHTLRIGLLTRRTPIKYRRTNIFYSIGGHGFALAQMEVEVIGHGKDEGGIPCPGSMGISG